MKGLFLDWNLFTGTEEEFLAVKEFSSKEWRLNGKFHRTNGPAHIWSDGSQIWYQNGLRHRTDGPAIIFSNGREEWCQNGKFHRTDGPALIGSDGYQAWFQNGKRHRTDGPSIINIKESVYYFYFEGLDFELLFPIGQENGLYIYNKK